MDDSTRDTARMKAIFLLAVAVAFALSPWASGQFGGFDPNRFPIPQDNPPIQPAGWAFSIWGLIYLALLAHAGYGLVRRGDAAVWDPMRWPLIISLAVGAAWIPVAQSSPIWALAMIWIMLEGARSALFRAPRSEALWAQAPVAIYAGWLTAASWVALAINGAGYGVLFGALGWAWIAVAGAVLMGTGIQWRLGRQPAYGWALAWAFAAIAIRNGGANPALTGAAIIAALAFTALPFFSIRR